MNLFSDYLRVVYPPLYVRKRTDRGPVWKFAKWLGLRVAYILYRLKISANVLNVVAIFVTLLAFVLLLFVQKGELWLKGARIAPYLPAGLRNADPIRDRKVLVKKKDVMRFAGKTHADGLTLVPISVYVTRGLVKLKFALARGKKVYEKRDKIKKRDAAREDREYA